VPPTIFSTFTTMLALTSTSRLILRASSLRLASVATARYETTRWVPMFVMYLAWLSFTKTLFQVIHLCIKYLNEGLTEFHTTAPCMTTILKYVVYLTVVYRDDTYLISCRFWIERKPEIYRRLTRRRRHMNMLQAGMRPSQAPLRLVSRYACLAVASVTARHIA